MSSKIMGQQVATVIENLVCDKDKANMQSTGAELRELGQKPLFVHKCPECGYTETVVGCLYPRTVEIPVGDPIHVTG